jgi:hypothetical protein
MAHSKYPYTQHVLPIGEGRVSWEDGLGGAGGNRLAAGVGGLGVFATMGYIACAWHDCVVGEDVSHCIVLFEEHKHLGLRPSFLD